MKGGGKESQSSMADCALGDEVYLQEGNMLSLAVAEGSTVSGKGCWDLVEVNCAAIEVQNPESERGGKGYTTKLWVVKSLGAGRFLDWRALDASRSAGEPVGRIWGEPWCVGGGFNIILSQRERSRQGRITLAMRRFAQVIDELELVDLPLQGGSFTWSGDLYNQAMGRLDDSLCLLASLIKEVLHHLGSKICGLKWKGLKTSYGAGGKGCRDVFGSLESNKFAALQQVEYWDQVESERRLIEEEISIKKEAKEGYAKWVNLEEIHWRQLSRELWLREGDRNTGYFHRMATAHRRRNSMDRIKINGIWLSEEQEVRTGIADAFKQLLTEDSEWKADIGGLNLNQISQQEAEILEFPFSEDEVHSALMDMNGDKAPSPDGFTVAFWQCCWEFVKEEVLEMFKEFHELLSSRASTTRFWSFYQKGGGGVLTNRIKKVIGKVVSPDQNAFVMGRLILDASLIANEKGLICKLDIEKAYDNVNWHFLMRVLQKMGFGSKWRDWMWSCISIAKFLVLVNGVPAGFFSSSKGLRQGDPLSPYLFVMGMEVLSVLIRRARGSGPVANISHLLFADDTIVFSEAKKEHLTYLSWILCCEIIPVGEVEEIVEMAVELGCKVDFLPRMWKQVLTPNITLGKRNLGGGLRRRIGAFGGVWKEILKESNWNGRTWDQNSSFEKEILALLKKLKHTKEQKALVVGKRRIKSRSSSRCSEFLWGSTGGVLVFWDNRALELLGLEKIFGKNWGAIRGFWSDPWCIGGDFNLVRFPRERSRGGQLQVDIRRFSKVINDLELRDLLLQGGGGLRSGLSPFRFEIMWLKVEDLKAKLKVWNKEVFKNVSSKNERALNQVALRDSEEATIVLTIEEYNARNLVREEYKKWSLLEETLWRQKLREL
ncbi:hypothetical protein AAG906_041175 [Vitis piasezkii]